MYLQQHRRREEPLQPAQWQQILTEFSLEEEFVLEYEFEPHLQGNFRNQVTYEYKLKMDITTFNGCEDVEEFLTGYKMWSTSLNI